jgi:hypothetical protein
MGLQPVVPAAEAAEVRAVGGTTAAVRDDVVEISPCRLAAAPRVPAGAVAGAHEAVLGRYRAVPVDSLRSVEDRAVAVGSRVVDAVAAHQTLELAAGHGRPQRAGRRFDDRDVERPADRGPPGHNESSCSSSARS